MKRKADIFEFISNEQDKSPLSLLQEDYFKWYNPENKINRFRTRSCACQMQRM